MSCENMGVMMMNHEWSVVAGLLGVNNFAKSQLISLVLDWILVRVPPNGRRNPAGSRDRIEGFGLERFLEAQGGSGP